MLEMSTSPRMALITRRRSNQSPPQSASQYHGRLLGAGPKDSNFEQVPSSCTYDEQTMASSHRSFRTSLFTGVGADSHHNFTDSRLEPSHSFGMQPLFSPQGERTGTKSPVLCKPVHNRSAEGSPNSRLTPTSAEAEQEDQADEEVEEEEQETMLIAESEESVGACQRPMTTAERRAEKRKARRFRSVL